MATTETMSMSSLPPPRLVVANETAAAEPPTKAVCSSRPSSLLSSMEEDFPSCSTQSLLSIEPLRYEESEDRTGGRRRGSSSNISFERHGSLIMAELCASLDDDGESLASSDSDDDDDEDSLDGIPTAAEAPEERPQDEDEGSSSFFHLSEASLDIDDIAAAVNSSRRSVAVAGSRLCGFTRNDNNNSRSSSSSSESSNPISRMEDEIIAKAVRDGKLVARANNDDDDSSAGGGTSVESALSLSSLRGSFSSSLRGGRGSFSFSRRWSGQRASFAGGSRPPSSSASLSSLCEGGGNMEGGNKSQRTSLRVSAGSDLRRNIQAALRELASDEEEEASDDQQQVAVAVKVEVKMAQPPPRDARPRRSSLKRPEQRRNWS